MRTKILTTTKRNDITDTREYMFNVSRMNSLISRGTSLTDFKVESNRYQVAVAIATLAGYVSSYTPGYLVSLTAIYENDKPVSKVIPLEVDDIIMAYAYSGNIAYTEIIYLNASGVSQRLVVNITLAILESTCNAVSGGGISGGGRAKAFGRVEVEADTPAEVEFTDPGTGGPVTMSSTNYIALVNGFDTDGPVDVQLSDITVTGFTLTVAADCVVYYAVFE